jgi:hypothetical protein
VATSSVLLADLHNYNTPTDTTDTNIGQDQFERKNDPNAPIWTINSEGHKLKITEKESGFDLDTKREKSSTSGHQKLMKNKGLHLILATFDGHVYIIDGVTKCSERIDVGEHIYSTPLLDDVTGACVYIYIYERKREICVFVCVYICIYMSVCIYRLLHVYYIHTTYLTLTFHILLQAMDFSTLSSAL